jgi:hypothetical protein
MIAGATAQDISGRFFLLIFLLSSSDYGKKKKVGREKSHRMDGHLLLLASSSPNRLSIPLSQHQGYKTPFET